MVTFLVHWEGRDLETMMASDITIISTSLIVGISVSIAGSSGEGESDMSLYFSKLENSREMGWAPSKSNPSQTKITTLTC